jgi:hypothetical protein
MDTKEAFVSQYLASLEMLQLAVQNCPDEFWNDPGYKNRFWHIAYHALFYTHLYAQVSVETFKAWEKHRPNMEQMGTPSNASDGESSVNEPYTKDEILSYIIFCAQDIQDKLAIVDMGAETSGFSWIPCGKLELQIYNIRHLQHHTAELMERLGECENISIPWVGKRFHL